MKFPVRALCAVLVCGMLVPIGSAVTDGSPVADSPNGAWLAAFASLVKETELRRRVNVLYPNPQSMFDGLQAGYVGVRHGNLTFRRRDIVAGPGELAQFSRVYDSRIRRGRDFGPGWRLPLAEELAITDGGMVYTDGSGARQFFRLSLPDERGRRAESQQSGQQVQIDADGSRAPSSIPVASGVYTAYPVTPQYASATLEVAGPLAVLRKGSTTCVFERQSRAGKYVLSSISVGDSTRLELAYRNGYISKVDDAEGTVFHIFRDGLGRIVLVQDRWGRSVQYVYGPRGRLVEARDMAGNVWSYQYAELGRLSRAIGPNGKDILRVRYDSGGRVTESHSGREYSFRYDAHETTVTEGTGHVHVFGRNSDGITNRFESTTGVWWELTLDDRNHVTELSSPGGTSRYAYGPKGEISNTVVSSAGGPDRREFNYDAQGRIASVNSSGRVSTRIEYSGNLIQIHDPQNPIAYEVLPSGQISFAQRGDTSIRAEYDGAGHLTAVWDGVNSVEFGRDGFGRVSDIRYANGEVNRYEYDSLGNRASVHFSYGGEVRYTHDPSGNIVEVAVTEVDGKEKRQVVQVGDMNRVERINYEGAGTLEIAYDGMGRATSFALGGDLISVSYEGPDRIEKIDSRSTGATWSPVFDDENRKRSAGMNDDRLALVRRDYVGATHPDYGVLRFEGFTAVAGDPVQSGVPRLLEARQLLAVAEPLFAGDDYEPMMGFEKPSNPVFQPLEYRSTNCCVAIPVLPQAVAPPCGTLTKLGQDPTLCFCIPIPKPKPCFNPVFITPANAIPPLPTYPELVNAGNSWGRTVVSQDTSALRCLKAACGGYRLEGDIKVASDSYIEVSTHVQAPRCKKTLRTAENKERTRDHEMRHAQALVGVINQHKGKLGTVYGNEDKCETGIEEFEEELEDAFSAEWRKQESHADFRGEKQYAAVCKNGKSKEVWLGDRYSLPGYHE